MYNISSITNNTHHWQHNNSDHHIQDNKKDQITIMDQHSYVWLYAMLLRVNTSNLLSEHAHGSGFAYEVLYGTIPEIDYFMHYRWWDPIYYYDTNQTFIVTKEQLGRCIGNHQYYPTMKAFLVK